MTHTLAQGLILLTVGRMGGGYIISLLIGATFAMFMAQVAINGLAMFAITGGASVAMIFAFAIISIATLTLVGAFLNFSDTKTRTCFKKGIYDGLAVVSGIYAFKGIGTQPWVSRIMAVILGIPTADGITDNIEECSK